MLAGRKKRQRIFLPGLLVEVRRQEPTGFVEEERINSDRLLAGQMLPDNFVSYRVESSGLSIYLLALFRAAGKHCLPILLAGRTIGPSTVLHAPSLRIDVLSPAEQRSKQRNLGLIV